MADGWVEAVAVQAGHEVGHQVGGRSPVAHPLAVDQRRQSRQPVAALGQLLALLRPEIPNQQQQQQQCRN